MAAKSKKVVVEFFSSMEQAKKLARDGSIEDLEVRCAIDDRPTARRMMTTLAAAQRKKLRIVLPVFETDLGPIVRAAKVERLDFVDRSLVNMKTYYAFSRAKDGSLSELIVTANLPLGGRKILGVTAARSVVPHLFDTLEKCLASLDTITKLTIRTKPPVTKREHKARLAEIAARSLSS